MHLPTYEDVVSAAKRLAGSVVRTPMLRNAFLDERTGGRILLKPEVLQRTGSFKFRGATNAIRALSERERKAGVLAYSSGNHAQAVAAAAAAEGISATVFMPVDAPQIKLENTRRWGAEIRLYDRVREDREALATAHAAATGAVLIPPYEHPEVIAGQGTAALELAEDARVLGMTMDALLVSTSGGGLVAGSALAMEGASPATRVYSVEPEGWDDTARSLASGKREHNIGGGSPLCDSLLAPTPGALTFSLNKTRLAGGLVVSEAEVLAAMAFAFHHFKLVLEPGGAVALAAVLAGRFDARGKVVGVLLSGGNVDPSVFARALAEPEAQRGASSGSLRP